MTIDQLFKMQKQALVVWNKLVEQCYKQDKSLFMNSKFIKSKWLCFSTESTDKDLD